MPTNQEWLHKLANESPDELKAWFEAEHVYDMDNAECVHMCPNEANDENQRESGVSGDDAHSNDANAHLKASEDLSDGFTDSREKLEADVYKYIAISITPNKEDDGVLAPYTTVLEWLDRQAAITKRETLHDNPKCSGRSTCAASSTCTANRPISESADRETHDTAGIGASKDEIRDFDVWSVAYEIYCAGGYVDNGNEPNPPTDGIRELLDRQAAITANANKELIEWQAATVARLQKEVDELTDSYEASSRALEILTLDKAKLATQVDKLQSYVDDATADYAKLVKERDNLADDLLTCNREREQLRKHLGIALDHAHDICALVDIDGNVLDVGD